MATTTLLTRRRREIQSTIDRLARAVGTTLLERRGSTLPGGHTTAVSLHSHTGYSREIMTLVPWYLERIPVVASMVRREMDTYRQRHGTAVDFGSGWWHPPVDADAVLASETTQITQDLGLVPLVSITDHDNIDAPLSLRDRHGLTDLPVSFEWTVPFEQGFFHLGVHNLPPSDAPELFRRLSRYTQCPDRAALSGLLESLQTDPGTLVVLNHPLWDLADVGAARHASLVREFLDDHGTTIHAIELNGYRSWMENAGAVQLAAAVDVPLISGGDRHGCAPNSLLNLTSTQSFGEFAREIRVERRSTILMMPAYRQSLIARKLAVAADAMRNNPSDPSGRLYWTDRVGYKQDGVVRRLSETWPNGGPWWVRSTMNAFRLATSAPMLPLMRMAVWLAGASKSRDTIPVIETRAAAGAAVASQTAAVESVK